jgi:hypothetical protein
MKKIDIAQGSMRAEAGRKIDTVVVAHSGIVSLFVGMPTGEIIEVALIGRESVLGASIANGGGPP